MRKKLQVFVSSTYEDLKSERQAAVQAILNAGHIPAGMELFTAGDQSQKDTIKKWIDESDVYLLILGGRYGTIDESSGVSYTHWEYEYAGQIGKPRFAIVISDEALEEKVKRHGMSVMETKNEAKYREFRKDVLSKMCKLYNDEKDIALAIYPKMGEYSSQTDLYGWVHGSDIPDVKEILNANSRLQKEIENLKKQLDKQTKKSEATLFQGVPFEELIKLLGSTKVTIPRDFFGSKEEEIRTLLDTFLKTKTYYATGVTNNNPMSNDAKYLYFKLAPLLMTYGLLEKVKVAGVRFEKIQTSKVGFEFLKMIELQRLKIKDETEIV
ncbi:DUF4062 domain-containing protein [Paenibacillus mesotrionivorans]|uniref:DUF4062 domain-containing protein n=1 Tax=Paenibacillus mesotrionivorans TaxID=3160968 RepID=A0ACC7P590_9BACL